MKYDLSILIPARNEEFLSRTVEDICANKEGKTEVIVVLDGQWANPPLVQHPDVTVVYLPEAIGQRAATNLACRLSKAKYVMKVDAHCAFDKGFDVKLMADMQDDWTVVPIMRNLHAFDWVCEEGHRRYQGPSGPCKECGKPTEKDVVWIAKKSPQSTAYRFDTDLHFQYHQEWKAKQVGDLVESMSIQGSCFMLTREKYWELDICEEKFGSWGQQGVEVACKTWLSGGRVIINKKTWYAHLFRTQGGDFGFPYPQSETKIREARQYSKDLFQKNNWKLAKHDFQWLLDKFAPLPGFHDTPTKGIIYYTDNRLNIKLAKKVREQLKKTNLPIVSASLKPMDFGKNIHIKEPRGYLTMFKQILAALEASDAEVVFLCEHDVIYHPSHFAFTPPKKDVYYYNVNMWKTDGKKAVKVDDCRQVSGLVAYRDLLVKHYRERVRRVEEEGFTRNMGFEPGTHNREERIDDFKSETFHSELPIIDIRHDNNLTNTRWSPDEFRDQRYTRGWTEREAEGLFRECGVEML
jgi:glycosyltransferase involved in cell wall biosynthesis